MAPTTSGMGSESLASSALVFGLSAANGHLPDAKRGGGGRTAKLQMRYARVHVEQPIIQMSADRGFRQRKGQLARANPQADRATRVVAGDDLQARPDQLGEVEAVADRCQHLGRRAISP